MLIGYNYCIMEKRWVRGRLTDNINITVLPQTPKLEVVAWVPRGENKCK